MGAQRNEPCPCGSGKKFKQCCEGKRQSSSQWLALVSVIIFAIAAVWVVAGVMRRSAEPAPADDPLSGRVWSEEHGHWHDAPGTPGTARPPGPAPPGKIWSAEHGHWHDAAGQEPAPAPGAAPPGKVWSEEHGHWHDAPVSP